LSLENRAPLTIPLPERQTQWDGGSRLDPEHFCVNHWLFSAELRVEVRKSGPIFG